MYKLLLKPQFVYFNYMYSKEQIIKYVKKLYQIWLLRVKLSNTRSQAMKAQLYSDIYDELTDLDLIIHRLQVSNNKELYDAINTGLSIFNLKIQLEKDDNHTNMWLTPDGDMHSPVSVTLI